MVRTLRHFDGKRYQLAGYVVMNDHVHVLIGPEDQFRLEDILHTWKSFTANNLQRRFKRVGPIWQDESFDRIVRNEREMYQKMLYVLNNPKRRWPELENYPWVWVNGMD